MLVHRNYSSWLSLAVELRLHNTGKQSITARLGFFLDGAQEGDRVPPFQKDLYFSYHFYFSLEISLLDQGRSRFDQHG